jgi:sialic acid synthase SpsE
MSTGMASIPEIEEAVDTAKKAGAKDIILLKCASNYPARPEDMNLKTIPHMKEKFDCPIGLSDHSLGKEVSIAAVALGAAVIEKHFTLSRKVKTPDSFFSIEPQELKELVENIRIVEKALGKVHYGLTEEEKKSRASNRRSLFVVKDISKGEIFSEENLRSIRPANGLNPKYITEVLGKAAKKNIKKGTPLSWGLVD